MIKIEKTQLKSNIPVAEAKLVFIKTLLTDAINGLSKRKDNGKLMLLPITEEDHNQAEYLKPVLVSESEKIEVGDWVLVRIDSRLQKKDIIIQANKIDTFAEDTFKVLALPEHFSPVDIQSIVDGMLKDGDNVLIECTSEYYPSQGHGTKGFTSTRIKLTSSNHIILHKVEEKMYTREELWNSVLTYNKSLPSFGTKHTIDDLKEWFEENIK